MAILSKIRERSLFLILVIGLALFAFVLDPSTISDFFNSSKVTEIGKVDGEVISREEFAKALENYRAQAGNQVSEMQAAKAVWSGLTRQKVYEAQLKEAGVTVGEADIINYLYTVPSVQNNPKYQTSGVFDKNKFKSDLARIKNGGGQEWKGLQNYMASSKVTIKRSIYDALVAAGLGASLSEGKSKYLSENTKVSGDFVFVPFSSVSDSLITVDKSEIQSYINSNKNDFQVDASRDIKYVKFDIKASEEDEKVLRTEVANLLEDSKENAAVKGLKNATDYKAFLEDNKSDLPLVEAAQFKVQVPQTIAEDVFKGEKGDVFGPYKDNGYYKISKIREIVRLPDSVGASHILIPYAGSLRAEAGVSRTKEGAKKLADSLLNVVKRNTSKFSDLAKEFSSDRGSKDKGGKYESFGYNAMTPAFRDFCFENKVGDIDVVETPFGYHVIKVDNQKNFQNAVKLVTFARKIDASEATENSIFQKAESFALEISKGENIDKLAEKNELKASSAQNLKALDEFVPGLGNERAIITWAFGKDTKVGDYKRFDVDGAYLVAVVTNKTKKGLMPVEKAVAKVRPIIANQKKAKMLEAKLKGSSLEQIATAAGESVKKATDVTLQSPTISGVGHEPKIVGAMINAKQDKVYSNVIGDRGVYAFKVTGKESPINLDNYESFRNKLIDRRRMDVNYRMYEALEKSTKIEDNVSSFYGI